MVFPIARLVVVFQREVVSLVLLLRVILRFCSSFWKSHLLDGTILCCFFNLVHVVKAMFQRADEDPK